MQFANPWGLLALLGIPAVLLIHTLRRNPKAYLTNTMFLIEAKLRDPGGGRRLRRLRRSAQLWLRLLLILAIAWVLARPVTVREDSTQRVVLVIDTSASMSASREALIPALEAAAKPWIKQTAHIEWIALSSVADAPPIHRGWDDFDALLDKIRDSEPREGSHDPGQALNLAQGLASVHGRVVFVTDHVPDPPLAGIGVLAVGSPVQNVGWCGVDVSPDGSWKAILRNYGDTEQSRQITAADGSRSQVDLGPGEWRSLQGSLPGGSSGAVISLQGDEFALDDQLHLIRRRAKGMSYTGLAVPTNVARLLEAGGVKKSPELAGADIEVRGNDLAPDDVEHARLMLPSKPGAEAPYVKVPATAASHELTEGLVFDGLLWRKCAPLNPPGSSDTVLLWSGSDPIAILRDGERTLELGFHPDLSNFSRVPSTLVLVQRWVDSIRAAKVAAESLQLSTGDRIFLATNPDGAELEIESDQGKSKQPAAERIALRAPSSPGTMMVQQDETTLLEAAVNFIDPIESDFRAADAGFLPPPEPSELVQESSLPDRFRDLWMLLAIALLLLSWTFPESNAPRASKSRDGGESQSKGESEALTA